MARKGLAPMRPLFDAMAPGWLLSPSPECGLLCVVLMALYGIRSEAALCDELARNDLFRWFIGLPSQGAALDPLLLAEVRTRLLRNSAAAEFLHELMTDARKAGLMVDEQLGLEHRKIALVPEQT
jgi:transposase